MSILYLAPSTAELLEAIAVDSNGALLTGLTSLRVRVRRVSDGFLFDWNDNTFKTGASVVTPLGTLTEISATYDPGHYGLSWPGAAAGAYEVTFTQTGTDAANLPASLSIRVGGLGALDAGALASGSITSSSFASGAITATAIAADAIGSSQLAASAVTEIQSGLATAAALATVQADTDNIQARLPAALVSGRIDAYIGAIGSTPRDEIVDYVWDEALTGATHNVATSAGRRLRELNVARLILTGTAGAGSSSTITLTGGVATDHIYRGNNVVLTNGTGTGQTRTILDYNGTTRVATIGPPWAVAPDNTSEFTVVSFGSPAVVDTGTLDGATSSSAMLADYSVTTNDHYIGMTLAILSGTGAGQSRRIMDYTGATKTAAIVPDWVTVPDTTSAYVLLGSSLTLSTVELAAVADAVWDEGLAGHVGAGSSGAALGAVPSASATADAVWDEALAGHATTGTAGAAMVLVDVAVSSRATAAAAGSAAATSVWATAEGGSAGSLQLALTLLRKHITNRLVATAGSSGNLVLYDDDATTPLKTWSITDGAGGAVTVPTGSPARRSGAT